MSESRGRGGGPARLVSANERRHEPVLERAQISLKSLLAATTAQQV